MHLSFPNYVENFYFILESFLKFIGRWKFSLLTSEKVEKLRKSHHFLSISFRDASKVRKAVEIFGPCKIFLHAVSDMVS